MILRRNKDRPWQVSLLLDIFALYFLFAVGKGIMDKGSGGGGAPEPVPPKLPVAGVVEDAGEGARSVASTTWALLQELELPLYQTGAMAQWHEHYAGLENEDPEAFFWLADPLVRTRVLPCVARAAEAFDANDGDWHQVAYFGAGARNRAVQIPLTFGIPWGFGGALENVLGITSSGAVVLGWKTGLPFAEGMELPVGLGGAADVPATLHVAALFGDVELRCGADGDSRVWWKTNAVEVVVVFENVYPAGCTNAFTTAVALDCEGTLALRYLDGVTPELLARTTSGVNLSRDGESHGFAMHWMDGGQLENPCGISNGVEIVMLRLGGGAPNLSAWAASRTPGELPMVLATLLGANPGARLTSGDGAMYSDLWLWENGFDIHTDYGGQTTASGLSFETAWRHYVDPNAPNPPGLTFAQRIAAGYDPNTASNGVPDTVAYDINLHLFGHVHGGAFHFAGLDAGEDSRRERFYIGPDDSKTVVVKAWWGPRYQVGGADLCWVELDKNAPVGVRVDTGMPAFPAKGPALMAFEPAAAGDGGEGGDGFMCSHHLAPMYAFMGTALSFGLCYQPTLPDEHRQSWPEGAVTVSFGTNTWVHHIEQPLTLHVHSPFIRQNGAHWHAPCGCRVVARGSGTDPGDGIIPMVCRASTGCGCVMSPAEEYTWYKPGVTIHGPDLYTSQVRRGDGGDNTANFTQFVYAIPEGMGDAFRLEVEARRVGFVRLTTGAPNAPYQMESTTQEVARLRVNGMLQWPATNSLYHLTWDGNSEHTLDWIEDVELENPHGGEPIPRFLHGLTTGQPVLGHHVDFVTRLRRVENDELYSEHTHRVHIKQIVKFEITTGGVSELTHLANGRNRRQMNAIGLTNLIEEAAAMSVYNQACTNTMDMINSYVLSFVVNPESLNLLEFVDEKTEVEGPYRRIIFTDADISHNTTNLKPSTKLGFSIGGSEDYFPPDGKNYVNLRVLLDEIHRHVPDLPKLKPPYAPLPAQTSLSELAIFMAHTATHEFGHNSGLVYRKYNAIVNVVDPHYQINYTHNRVEPFLIMNAGDMVPVDIMLGKYGLQEWSGYDKLHFFHQFIVLR